MPGFRYSCRDNYHVASRRIVVAGRADDIRIESHHRRGLHKVQGFAFGHVSSLWDIDQDNIAQFCCSAPVRRRRSHISSTDDTDLGSPHGLNPLVDSCDLLGELL